MWSRKPMPVAISAAPVPSRSTRPLIRVSLVLRSTVATRTPLSRTRTRRHRRRPSSKNGPVPPVCPRIASGAAAIAGVPSKPAARGEAVQRLRIVHVFEPGGKPDRDPARQVASASASACGPDQRTFPNSGGRRGERRAPTSQKPPSAAGPNTRSCLPEQAERLGDMPGLDRRNIGADQHRRTRRAGGQRPPHAHAEIAGALRSDRGGARPQPLARRCCGPALPRAAAASGGRGQAGAPKAPSIARSNRSAARSPTSPASRRLPTPRRGARTNSTRCRRVTPSSAIKPRDMARRHTGEIQRQAEQIAQRSPEISLLAIAPGRAMERHRDRARAGGARDGEPDRHPPSAGSRQTRRPRHRAGERSTIPGRRKAAPAASSAIARCAQAAAPRCSGHPARRQNNRPDRPRPVRR